MSLPNPDILNDAISKNESPQIGSKIIAATPGQKALWWLDNTLLQPESYNVPVLVNVDTALDFDTLQQAVLLLTKHYSLFRTRFIFSDQELSQFIENKSQISFSRHYLSEKETPESFMNKLASTRISLTDGPLTIITMLTNAADQTWLACCFHHILVDAPSVRLILHELLRFYVKIVAENRAIAPKAVLSYENFTRWQSSLLASSEAAEMRHYWQDLLTPPPQLTDLPVDFPRKDSEDAKADYAYLTLSEEEEKEIKLQARQLAMTPFMYLTMCWQFFLHRITGQNDITIGIPFTLRDIDEFENTPGYMINTLPLRVEILPNETVKNFANHIRERFIEAHVNKSIPFSEIVASSGEKLRQDSPLFSTMLVMPDIRSDIFEDLPFTVTINDYFSQAAKYDLTLFVENQPFWRLVIEYKTALFHKDTLVNWLTLFRRLLLSMGQKSNTSLESLILMDTEEQHKIIIRSSNEKYPNSAIDALTQFNDYAHRNPSNIALSVLNEEYTYRWLAQCSDQVAASLHRKFCIGPEHRVALLLERNADAIAVLFGVLKTGASYIPIDPQYPPERVEYMLRDASVDCIVTTEELSKTLSTSAPIFLINSLKVDDTVSWQTVERRPEDEFYIIYTSGSTGHPKGVRLLNKTLYNLLAWQDKISECEEGACTLHYMSLSFDVSILEIFGTLCHGGKLYIASEEERKDLHHLQNVIQKKAIQRIYFPYVALQQFAHLSVLNDSSFPQLREVYSTGEQLVLTADIKRFFTQPIRLINLYGPSESHVCSAYILPANSELWADTASIGYPLPGFSLLVVDQLQRLVPPGTAGELLIVSDFLSPGYHNKETETHQQFSEGNWHAAQSHYAYRSGDLVRFEHSDTFTYLGRIDNQLKIRGFRIEPSEVEATINKLEGVQVSAVIGKDVALGNKQLIAFITGISATKKSDILRHLHIYLPEYMVPSELVFLDILPTTPSGKIDRKALFGLNLSHSPEEETSNEPLTETELQVKKLWENIFPGKKIISRDNFFAIGGHSLLATQLVYLLRQHFKIDIPLRLLFNNPTLTDMASSIDSYLANTEQSENRLDYTFIKDGYIQHDWSQKKLTPITVNKGDILLTGSTGFLGIYLLRSLLKLYSNKVVCIIRASSSMEGKSRLYENAQRYGIAEDIDFSRIDVYSGDISKPDLGLAPEQYHKLSERIESVFHAAAHINFILSYSSVKETNVDGILKIIDFCVNIRRKKMNYISTIAVFSPHYPLQPISEDDEAEFPDTLSIGYTQSKWVAERYVLQARQQGIDINIYRIGRIAGDSRTGACQTDDFLWRQIKSFIQMGIAPEAKMLETDLLPVDFVGEAIATLAYYETDPNCNYHLFHPTGTNFEPVYQAIRKLGYPVRITSDSDWMQQLEKQVMEGQDIALGSVIHLFNENSLDTGNNQYNNAITCQKIAQKGLVFPPITEDTFIRMITYFESQGEIPVKTID